MSERWKGGIVILNLLAATASVYRNNFVASFFHLMVAGLLWMVMNLEDDHEHDHQ